MKIPNSDQAYVERAKVAEYLLTEEAKSGFFLRFGFTIEDWRVLAEALASHAQTHDTAYPAGAYR